MPRAQHSTAPQWQDYFRQRAAESRDDDLRRFYTAGVPKSDTPIADVSFMALDFETTGMDAGRDAIVSIGMVPFSLQRIRPAAGAYWVIKPSAPLESVSVGIHHITHSEVLQAPRLEAVLGDVLARLSGHVAVVHYHPIERPFLDHAVLALRGEHCLFPLIDTMALEARRQQQGLVARLKRWLGMSQPSIRLAQSRERYGLPDYTSHHAKVDAMATAELFVAQVARYYSPQTAVGELWI